MIRARCELRLLVMMLGLTAVLSWMGREARGAEPSKARRFPEPTQFDAKPFALRLEDDALAVAYSPDGNLLAVGCGDGVIRLWDSATGKLLGQLTGHRDASAAVAFSPDGTKLASASYDKTVRIWDVSSRKESAVLTGHTNAVLAVAFLPEGDKLVSGGADRLLKTWDLAAGKETGSYGQHQGAIRGLAVSPDGKLVASAGSDRRILLWDTKGWTVAATLRKHTGAVRSVAFSPDGQVLASGSEDKTAILWDVPKREVRHILEGHDETVTAVAFSPRGELLATGSTDKTLRLWQSATGGELANLEEGHTDALQGVAFAPSGRQIATASADKTVGLWSAALPRVFASQTLTARAGWTGVVAVSSDGKYLAAVGENFAILLQDAQNGELKATLQGHRGTIVQLAFSPDGARLVSVGRDRVGILWDVATGQRHALLDGHRGAVRAAAFSPDGRLLVTGGSDKRILIYDLPAPGTKLTELRERTAWVGHQGVLTCLAFSPDGKFLASGTETTTRNGPAELKLWEVSSGQTTATWTEHKADIASVAFHPTRPLLVSAGADPGFRVWDLTKRKPILFRATQSTITSLAFSPRGEELLTGSAGRTLLAWDTEDWREAIRFIGHTGGLTGLTVVTRTSEPLLCSASTDKSFRTWSLTPVAATGVRFTGHESWVTALAVLPDGKTLLSGSWDGTVRVWEWKRVRQTPCWRLTKRKSTRLL